MRLYQSATAFLKRKGGMLQSSEGILVNAGHSIHLRVGKDACTGAWLLPLLPASPEAQWRRLHWQRRDTRNKTPDVWSTDAVAMDADGCGVLY